MSRMKNGRSYIACGVGVCTMILLSAAMVLTLPVFIQNEYLTMEYTKGIIIILMGIVAFAGTIAARIVAGETVYVPAISVGIYYILIVFMSVFFFDGLTLRVLYGLMSLVVGYFVAWMLMRKLKKPHNNRKKLRRNR